MGRENIWASFIGVACADFPPPKGLRGEQRGAWGDCDYARACTDRETATLAADCDAGDRAADEELRDRWFALLEGRGEGD